MPAQPVEMAAMRFLQYGMTHGESALRESAAENQQHYDCYELKSASSSHESFRVEADFVSLLPRE